MRVVDVTQWYSPISGGIRTYLHAKAHWAARAGTDHAAVVTGTGDFRQTVGQSPFVAYPGITLNENWCYRLATSPGPMLKALEELEPDVVVVHDAFAFPVAIAKWCRRSGVAVAGFCHSELSLGAVALRPVLRIPSQIGLRHLQRRFLRSMSVIFATSDATIAAIAGEHRTPVIRNPLGIDLSDFVGARPDLGLRRRLTPRGGPLLVHAGRLTSDKRVDLLVPALAGLRDGVLAVAGRGTMQRAIEREARAAGVADRLVMLGHIPERSTLASVLATADCFIHPNPREPYGLGPLEALAAGCRVVAPRTDGTGEVLATRGAVLVAPDDPGALAAGVRTALARPRPRPDMSDLDWDDTFARELRVYEQLTAHVPEPAARLAA